MRGLLKPDATASTADRAAEQLLHDLDVSAGIAVAQPDRLMFEDLAPYFGRRSEALLVDRLLNAYLQAGDSAQALRFKKSVEIAFDRVTGMWLGEQRTLLILDLVHSIADNKFSAERWRKLIWRAEAGDAPHWLGELALRGLAWKVVADFEMHDWCNMLESVEPQGFEAMLRWVSEYVRTLSRSAMPDALNRIYSVMEERLGVDHNTFAAARINTSELVERFEKRVATAFNLVPTDFRKSAASEEEDRLKRDLRAATEPSLGVVALRREVGKTSPAHVFD